MLSYVFRAYEAPHSAPSTVGIAQNVDFFQLKPGTASETALLVPNGIRI